MPAGELLSYSVKILQSVDWEINLLTFFVFSLPVSNQFLLFLGVLQNLNETNLDNLFTPLLHQHPTLPFSMIIQETSNSYPFEITILLLRRKSKKMPTSILPRWDLFIQSQQ